MSNVTMLDTSVFGALNRANSAQAVARDLLDLLAQGETLMVGATTYQEILKTPGQALREAQLRQIKDFKMVIQQSTMADRAVIFDDYIDNTVDKAGTKFTPKRAGVELKDLPILSDVRVQMAAGKGRVNFFTVDRMVNNQVTITRAYNIQFCPCSRVLNNMGPTIPYNPQALGITTAGTKATAAESAAPTAAQRPAPKSVATAPKPPATAPKPPATSAATAAPESVPTSGPKSVPVPKTGPVKAHVTALKLGLKGALSAPSLASLIPDGILLIADKFAVRDAIRTITVKFIKEGFAKGVAAGVMRWNRDDVALNLKNRVTHDRVRGLGDAKGTLKLGPILRLAEGYENYAVDVGFEYTFSQTVGWNNDLQRKGLAALAKRGYDFGTDPAKLFEYPFIDTLASVLRPTTDAIVGPAIKFN